MDEFKKVYLMQPVGYEKERQLAIEFECIMEDADRSVPHVLHEGVAFPNDRKFSMEINRILRDKMMAIIKEQKLDMERVKYEIGESQKWSYEQLVENYHAYDTHLLSIEPTEGESEE